MLLELLVLLSAVAALALSLTSPVRNPHGLESHHPRRRVPLRGVDEQQGATPRERGERPAERHQRWYRTWLAGGRLSPRLGGGDRAAGSGLHQGEGIRSDGHQVAGGRGSSRWPFPAGGHWRQHEFFPQRRDPGRVVTPLHRSHVTGEGVLSVWNGPVRHGAELAAGPAGDRDAGTTRGPRPGDPQCRTPQLAAGSADHGDLGVGDGPTRLSPRSPCYFGCEHCTGNALCDWCRACGTLDPDQRPSRQEAR